MTVTEDPTTTPPADGPGGTTTTTDDGSGGSGGIPGFGATITLVALLAALLVARRRV